MIDTAHKMNQSFYASKCPHPIHFSFWFVALKAALGCSDLHGLWFKHQSSVVCSFTIKPSKNKFNIPTQCSSVLTLWKAWENPTNASIIPLIIIWMIITVRSWDPPKPSRTKDNQPVWHLCKQSCFKTQCPLNMGRDTLRARNVWIWKKVCKCLWLLDWMWILF